VTERGRLRRKTTRGRDSGEYKTMRPCANGGVPILVTTKAQAAVKKEKGVEKTILGWVDGLASHSKGKHLVRRRNRKAEREKRK